MSLPLVTYIVFFGKPYSTNKHKASNQQSNTEIKMDQIALFSKCDTPTFDIQ